MPSDRDPLQPIEQLRSEHAMLLDEMGILSQFTEPTPVGRGSLTERVAKVLKFLELHQDTEERFLFPLVSRLGGGLLGGIREEHLGLLSSSDRLVAAAAMNQDGEFLRELSDFGRELKRHFSAEEAAVFEPSIEILSPVQMDILRIMFASRRIVEI